MTRVARPECSDKQRTVRRLSSFLNIVVEIATDAAREEHGARPVVFAVDANTPSYPIDIFQVCGQRLAAAQAASR
jgi:hypothetical protein